MTRPLFMLQLGKQNKTTITAHLLRSMRLMNMPTCSLFLDDTKGVGVAVTADGDIVSVFKNPGRSAVRGSVSSILLTAIQNGGVKLDNFDGVLSFTTTMALSPLHVLHLWTSMRRTIGTMSGTDARILSFGFTTARARSRLLPRSAPVSCPTWPKAPRCPSRLTPACFPTRCNWGAAARPVALTALKTLHIIRK